MGKKLFKSAKSADQDHKLPVKGSKDDYEERSTGRQKTSEEATRVSKKSNNHQNLNEEQKSFKVAEHVKFEKAPKLKPNKKKDNNPILKNESLTKPKKASSKNKQAKQDKVAKKMEENNAAPKATLMKKGGFTSRLGISRHALKPVNFKFAPAIRNILATSRVAIKAGGTISLEFGRNMEDKRDIKPGGTLNKTENDWTCKIETISAAVTNRDNVILNPQFDKIYVGGVYDIKNILNGQYNEVPYKRKPLRLFNDNYGAKNVLFEVQDPNSGNVQQAISNLSRNQKIVGSKGSGYKYEMDSMESFFMKTGGSGYYLFAKASFDVDFKSVTKSHKYIFEFVETFYTISVSNTQKEPSDFFHIKEESTDAHAVSEKDIDPNWVFVDSVSYGRMLYVIFESAYSLEEFGFKANASADVIFAAAEGHFSERQKKILSQVSWNVLNVGGDAKKAGLIANSKSYEDLQIKIDDYIKSIGDPFKISYTLATLDHATVGSKMMTDYTSRQCAPRASKYRVSWTDFQNTVNDDSGGSGEYRAVVGIYAKDGKGKTIMDVDKMNSKQEVWEKADKNMRVLLGKPWTFTVGNDSNPLDIKEGKGWNPNKAIEFEIPTEDKNAKIIIQVDAVEYDDWPNANDDYSREERIFKISELSNSVGVDIISHEEEGRVTFKFKIEPVY